METEILEAQARLEGRRKELSATTIQLTSLAEEMQKSEVPVKENCDVCGTEKTALFGMNRLVCIPCTEAAVKKQDEEYQEEIRRVSTAINNQKTNELISSCAIGERFRGMTFDDYKPVDKRAAETLEACKDYVSNFTGKSSTNLLMIGSPGTGKNMLAAIICQELIKMGFPCLHTTAMKLVRKVKDSWRDKEISEQSVIDSMVEPALLVIDEIGVQFGSATEQLYLTEIINERYEKRRPTILISNLKLSELTAIMGERVIDRFYDDGSKILVFAWQSYRRELHRQAGELGR